jgi:2-iminobutanoate/2-iminopropanoate deaminase
MGFADAVTTSGLGRTIHVSGNVGFGGVPGPDGQVGKVVSGGMEAEARATFACIERALKLAGADMAHVVKINAYVTSLDNYGEYAKVRNEVFGEHMPASATVQVAGLLVGAQIEIDAVAFVPEGS